MRFTEYRSRKLQDWDDTDGFGPMTVSEDTSIDKTSRVVVLRHMFTLQELDEDTSLLLDLKDDVREECSTLGEVTNVVLYDVRRYISLALITVNIHFSKNQTVS